MRVMVTGAAGFAGRWLIRELLAQGGTEVIGLYHHAEPDRSSGVPFMQADLTDRGELGTILATTKPDALVHLAAISRPREANNDPARGRIANIETSENILQVVAERAPQCKLLFVSSSEIYGKVAAGENPLTEERGAAPANFYGESKTAMEQLCHDAFKEGAPVVIARPFNHTGPGQERGFVAPDIAWQVAQREAEVAAKPTISTGNLEAQRDFCDVRDVVRAYRLLLEKGEPGEIYNICSGRPVVIQDILDRLLRLSTRTDLRHVIDPEKKGASANPLIYGSYDKLARATGWAPTYDLESTLADLLRSCRFSLSQKTGA